MCIIKLTELDDLLRPDHYFITSADRVYFIREFIARGGFGASATNQLIANLKISPLETHRLTYKRRAITQCADELTRLFPARLLENCTFVPIPPSASKEDPSFDNRLMQILQQMHPGDATKDVRELVCQRITTKKSHCSGNDRLKVQELIDIYELDIKSIESARENIVLFDDILTAGAHYHAMKTVLTQVRADLNIVGIFIARVIRPQDESLEPGPL